MAARTGMANLITRLRGLTNAGTAEHSIDGVSYFSDAHLQDVLDSNVTHIEYQPIKWLPDTVGGGSIEYHRAALGWRDLEEAESGTIYWGVRESTGTLQGTAAYTKDYITGQLYWAADTGGSILYWQGRSYDLYASAADVWLRRQSFYSDWYEFQSESQRFSRQQTFEHAEKMEKQMRARAGQNRGKGSVRTNIFSRTDINPRGV